MAVKRGSLWVASIVLLGAAVALIWQVRVNRQQAARLVELASENTRLRQRAEDLARQAQVPPPPSPEPATETHNTPRPAKSLGTAEDAAFIGRLRQKLTDANSTIAQLQSRAADYEAELQTLHVDNQRLAASEADLKASLATANGAVDALQKELKSKSDRTTQVEIAYQRLRDQSGGDAQKIAQLQQLTKELQDIHQRREVYLNSILRRYKQITEQYRSLAGIFQAQRTDAPGAGSADLARIQDSISMAEEDLRQLNNLNAQALRIQKKMEGK